MWLVRWSTGLWTTWECCYLRCKQHLPNFYCQKHGMNRSTQFSWENMMLMTKIGPASRQVCNCTVLGPSILRRAMCSVIKGTGAKTCSSLKWCLNEHSLVQEKHFVPSRWCLRQRSKELFVLVNFAMVMLSGLPTAGRGQSINCSTFPCNHKVFATSHFCLVKENSQKKTCPFASLNFVLGLVGLGFWM